MIKISDLSLSYLDNQILEDINIEINEPGLYLIYGESGSGKTSLLNVLSLMEDKYDGKYLLFDKDVSLMSKKEKLIERFSKLTYLFQIPKLIENESIKVNLEISLGRKISRKEEKEFLKKIHLSNINKKVSVLSGGEKQRVNILMGILRDTPIIFGDEITSGLDNLNKEIIMKLLKEESKKKIIILVSHDVEFIKPYAKEARKIENKKLVPLSRKRKHKFKVMEKKKNKLPLSYSLKHVINVLNLKKFRFLISTFSSIIALTFLGLCLMLTSSLKDMVMNSLGSIIKENNIVMEMKEEGYALSDNISLSKDKLLEIKERYKRKVKYLGVNYISDIDNYFQDENYFAYSINDSLINIPYLDVNQIKDYGLINEENIDLFYLSKEELQEDEVVLSLSHGEISRLCTLLNIEYKDDSSLLPYLKSSPLKVNMYLSNESWEYNLETTLYLVGYIPSDEPKFYHTDSFWNEYIIESVMQMESSLNLESVDYYPWTVKKAYYLYVNSEDINSFLKSILEDKIMNDYSFKLFKKDDDFGIYFKYVSNNLIPLTLGNSLVYENDFLDGFFPCSSSTYNVVSNVLIAGFTKPTYISSDYELLEEFININSYSEDNLDSYQGLTFSYTNEEIVSLGLIDATKDNFASLKISHEDLDYDEIFISRGLLNKLHMNDSLINNQIYSLRLTNVNKKGNQYENEFKIANIKVKGIVESEDNEIYVNYLWPVIFPLICYDEEYAGNTSFLFDYKGNSIVEDRIKLNENNPDYTFSNPYLEYAKSIDEVGYYLTLGLSVFSGFCLLSTLIMLICASSLFVNETRKEIGIYSLYGYEERSVKRLYKIFSYVIILYSFLVSSFCLFFLCFIMKNGDYLLKINTFNVLLVPLEVMGCVSLIIGFITSRTSTNKVFRQDALKQLKEK